MNRNDNVVPRLHVGAGPSDGTKMCAMQVVSWENGDKEITSLPACSDPMLARIVQRINDTQCGHRDDRGLLCSPCSVEVLALAHRTVGTTDHSLGEAALRQVWVKVALDQARQVQHLVPPEPRGAVEDCLLAVEAWLRGAASRGEVRDAADAAYAAAYYAADAAYAAAYYAAYAAADADDDAACSATAAYSTAAYSTADAYSAAADAAAGRMRLAHRAVNVFLRETGLTKRQPAPERARAEAMTGTCERLVVLP